MTEAAGVVSETFSEDQLATMQGWADSDGWLKNDDGALTAETPDAFGNAAPEAYRFEVPAHMEAVEIEDLAQVQAAMTEAGIPAAIGNEMANQWNRYMAAGAADETTLKLGAIAARQELTRKYGDQADEVLRTAKQEIAKISKKAPWILEGLETTELGNSTWLVETLWNISQQRGKP